MKYIISILFLATLVSCTTTPFDPNNPDMTFSRGCKALADACKDVCLDKKIDSALVTGIEGFSLTCDCIED